jgi:hypothetical protein
MVIEGVVLFFFYSCFFFQVALCESGEDGLTIHCACQCGELIQTAVSRFLGISASKSGKSYIFDLIFLAV